MLSLDLFCVIVFTIEYVIRIFTVPFVPARVARLLVDEFEDDEPPDIDLDEENEVLHYVEHILDDFKTKRKRRKKSIFEKIKDGMKEKIRMSIKPDHLRDEYYADTSPNKIEIESPSHSQSHSLNTFDFNFTNVYDSQNMQHLSAKILADQQKESLEQQKESDEHSSHDSDHDHDHEQDEYRSISDLSEIDEQEKPSSLTKRPDFTKSLSVLFESGDMTELQKTINFSQTIPVKSVMTFMGNPTNKQDIDYNMIYKFILYLFKIYNIIDFLAIVPYYIQLAPGNKSVSLQFIRVIRLFRVVRVFKVRLPPFFHY